MTRDEDMFCELVENDDPQKYVTFGDNSKGKVVGLGNVTPNMRYYPKETRRSHQG